MNRPRFPMLALRLLAGSGAVTLAAALPGQQFTYPDFSSTAQLALLGDATVTGSATLRLTATAANQSSWVWRQAPVDISLGFTTTFTFRITPPAVGTKAEGLAFVLHGDPAGAAATGGTAWGLGYGIGASGSNGITRSIAIEIDTFRDLVHGDTSDNELSIHTRGALGNNEAEQFSLARTTPATDLADGAVHTIEIRYSLPGTLEVFIDGGATPALACAYNHVSGGQYLNGAMAQGANLSNGMATVGFCATTGAGALTELVELLSWSYASTSPKPPCYDGTLGADTLTVDGDAGGALREVGLVTAQSFGIELASPPLFGPGAPYVLFVSLLPQPGAPGTQFGFGETCFPVLPLGPTELVLADTIGLFPALFPAAPTPHTIALPAGTVPMPLSFTLQAVTFSSSSPLALGVTNAIDVSFEPGPAPVVTFVLPLSGVLGQPIAVNGQNFVPGLAVTIDGVPVALNTVTPTQITFAYPGGVACDAQLTVVNPDGQSATTAFNPTPIVTGTLLNSGTAAGNQVFVVQGTGFSPGTTVTIGGAPAIVIGVTSTTVTMRTPPGMPGVAPVVLTTPGGCTATTTYTYL